MSEINNHISSPSSSIAKPSIMPENMREYVNHLKAQKNAALPETSKALSIKAASIEDKKRATTNLNAILQERDAALHTAKQAVQSAENYQLHYEEAQAANLEYQKAFQQYQQDMEALEDKLWKAESEVERMKGKFVDPKEVEDLRRLRVETRGVELSVLERDRLDILERSLVMIQEEMGRAVNGELVAIKKNREYEMVVERLRARVGECEAGLAQADGRVRSLLEQLEEQRVERGAEGMDFDAQMGNMSVSVVERAEEDGMYRPRPGSPTPARGYRSRPRMMPTPASSANSSPSRRSSSNHLPLRKASPAFIPRPIDTPVTQPTEFTIFVDETLPTSPPSDLTTPFHTTHSSPRIPEEIIIFIQPQEPKAYPLLRRLRNVLHKKYFFDMQGPPEVLKRLVNDMKEQEASERSAQNLVKEHANLETKLRELQARNADYADDNRDLREYMKMLQLSVSEQAEKHEKVREAIEEKLRMEVEAKSVKGRMLKQMRKEYEELAFSQMRRSEGLRRVQERLQGQWEGLHEGLGEYGRPEEQSAAQDNCVQQRIRSQEQDSLDILQRCATHVPNKESDESVANGFFGRLFGRKRVRDSE